MSKKDQQHSHKWQRRVRDWLIVPHSRVPNPHDVTPAELARHASERDCWVAIHGEVYDVTRFLNFHPGGAKIIHAVAGRDCTDAYERNHTALDPGLVVGMCRVGALVARDGDSHGAPPGYCGPSLNAETDMLELAKKSGLFAGTSEAVLGKAAAAAAAAAGAGHGSTSTREGESSRSTTSSSSCTAAAGGAPHSTPSALLPCGAPTSQDGGSGDASNYELGDCGKGDGDAGVGGGGGGEAEDYEAVFDMLDTAAAGFISVEQLLQFLRTIDTDENEIATILERLRGVESGNLERITRDAFVRLFNC